VKDPETQIPNFKKRIPELDGIRGLAILTIIAFHWFILEGNGFLPVRLVDAGRFGWSGVDLFFVLSGFLIGGILLDARHSSNYYRVFYVRRFYRILPLYWLFCLLSVGVFYLRLGTHDWLFSGKIPWYAYLTFGQNFSMVKFNTLGSREIDSTWSLAIEEQFYLTLPLLVRVVKEKFLPYLLGAGILAAPVIRTLIWFHAAPVNRYAETFLLTPCRMDALLLGVLIAWMVRRETSWRWLVSHRGILRGASVGLLLGFGLMIYQNWNTSSFEMASFGYTWIALFFSSLLLLAITGKKGWLSRFFRLPILTYLGILAYGLYLFHEPFLGIVFGLWGAALPRVESTVSLALTLLSGAGVLLLAALSWKFFEKPLMKLGHRLEYDDRPKEQRAAEPRTGDPTGGPALTVPEHPASIIA
jgi:peptidoglycan/LPS O-acetylase OafA/YrhL